MCSKVTLLVKLIYEGQDSFNLNEFVTCFSAISGLYLPLCKRMAQEPKVVIILLPGLLLPLNNLLKEVGGLTGRNILRQQLQTGRIEMPLTANTVRDSGAVDMTLEDRDVDCKKEEETTTRSGLNTAFLHCTSQHS